MITNVLTLTAVGLASVIDLKTRKIPNLITFGSIIGGLCINTIMSGIFGAKNSLLGASIGILILFIPFILGGMGAGDVKLLAAVGAINGVPFVIYTFLYGAIVGGVIALMVAIINGKLYQVLFNTLIMFQNGIKKEYPAVTSQIKFPYGVSILAGTVATYLLR